jgi:hypothetical protein
MAQKAQGGDVELQPRRRRDVQAHPGNCDRAEDVPVCEGEHPSAATVRKGDEFQRSRVDLCRCLAAGATVEVDLPSRA